MSLNGWRTALVLGGIRSGKSEYAESLIGDSVPVRYVATGAARDDDPEWSGRLATHRDRRPDGWQIEETGGDPLRLLELLDAAKPEDTLLVDDLGGWVTGLLDPARQPADDVATIADLARAVGGCAGRVVLVSPEVGLSMVPLTPVGRAFADALGTVNQALAAACDAVVLVVAGQPSVLKPAATVAPPVGAAPVGAAPVAAPPAEAAPGEAAPGEAAPGEAAPAVAASASVPAPVEPLPPSPQVYAPATAEPTTDEPPLTGGDALTAPTMSLPALSSGLVIQPGMHLPMPDEYEPPLARDRLLTLDVDGAGFGALEGVVSFAAGTQSRTVPVPWRRPRAVLVVGDHAGGAEAGTLPGDSAHKADQARAGEGPLARLAGLAGAELQVVDAPAAAAMEDGPALSPEAVESALRYGWRLAEEASDAGIDVLLLGACGSGSAAAAAAVVAATTGAEAAGLLGRVIVPGGEVDDDAWMSRLTAVRDALQRTRRAPRGAKDVLADLGGGDIAVATGLLLGAAARKLPVILDGPVGVAAALVTRDLAGQARHWCLLADTGGHPTVRLAADILGLTPTFTLRLDLGEGANALAALPTLVTALTLAAALPVHPTLAPDDDAAASDDADDADDEVADDGVADEDEDAHPGV